MSTHIDIAETQPVTYRHLLALDAAAERAMADAGLGSLLPELVKLRVSQLNGCAYCLRLHTRDALAKGGTPERLAMVAAWWESQHFDATERAALALAEQVTRMTVPENRTWDDGSLTVEQVGAITWLAITMNAWNRLAVSSHYPVGPQD